MINNLLTGKVNKWLQVVFLLIILLVPLKNLADHYNPQNGFTSLIMFGQDFEPRFIDAIKEIPKAIYSPGGYDGQFYAQLAVDPSLNNPKFANAFDYASYRARRIFLPLLAFLIGLGNPYWIVQVYALLNSLIFILFIFVFLKIFKPTTLKVYLCLFAMTCTAGTFISISRSLIDFPAAAFLLFAPLFASPWSYILLSLSILTKETSVLGIFAVIWPEKISKNEIIRNLLNGAAVILPATVWFFYAQYKLPGGISLDVQNFSSPVLALVNHFLSSTKYFLASYDIKALGEILAMSSLIIETIFIFTNISFRSPFWRMGAGFAILFYVMGNPVYSELASYVRNMLPLTFAFNILLMSKDNKSFIKWYILGNVGLLFNILNL